MNHINSVCPVCGKVFREKSDLYLHLPCKGAGKGTNKSKKVNRK